MLFTNKKKPRERFYLLPGQGGRNYARKQQQIMRWTVAASLCLGLLMGAVMWWCSRRPHL